MKGFLNILILGSTVAFWGCREETPIESVSERSYPRPVVPVSDSNPKVDPLTHVPPARESSPPSSTAPAPPKKIEPMVQGSPANPVEKPVNAPTKASQEVSADVWVENRGQAEYTTFLEKTLAVQLDELHAFFQDPEVREEFSQFQESFNERTKNLDKFDPYGPLGKLQSSEGFVVKKDGNCVDQVLSPTCDRLASIPVFDANKRRIPVVSRWNRKNFPIEIGLHTSFDPKYKPIVEFVVRQYNAFTKDFLSGTPILRFNPHPSGESHANPSRHLLYFSDFDYKTQSALQSRHPGLGYTYQITLQTGEILDSDIDIAYGAINGVAFLAHRLNPEIDDLDEKVIVMFLYYVIAHEIGHFLGMDHNFYSKDYHSLTNYYAPSEFPTMLPWLFDSQGRRGYDYLTLRYIYDDAFVDIQQLPYSVLRERKEEKSDESDG